MALQVWPPQCLPPSSHIFCQPTNVIDVREAWLCSMPIRSRSIDANACGVSGCGCYRHLRREVLHTAVLPIRGTDTRMGPAFSKRRFVPQEGGQGTDVHVRGRAESVRDE